MVVWIGQEYSREVRRLVDSYAKDVPYYELPGWHHQRIWWENGGDPHDHQWAELGFGYFQRRDQFFKELGVKYLPGLRVRAMEDALHDRRYAMDVYHYTRQAAVPRVPVVATFRGARRTAGVSGPESPTRPMCINHSVPTKLSHPKAVDYRARVANSLSMAPGSPTARVSTANKLDQPAGEASVAEDLQESDQYSEDFAEYASSISSENDSASASERIKLESQYGQKRLKRKLEAETAEEPEALQDAVDASVSTSSSRTAIVDHSAPGANQYRRLRARRESYD